MDKDKLKSINLKDLLEYDTDTYLKPEELALIKSTFRGNKTIFKVLKKLLLPSIFDQDMPVEELGNDVWLVGRDYSAIPNDEVKSIVLARQEAIKFICGGLVKLRVIAESKTETPEEVALRRKSDSTK